MSEASATAGRGVVLVVEDERAISDLLRMYLAREGFGVHVSTTGPDGLSAAKTLHPAAILLDVGLPGMDGTEVCRQLRADGDWVPICSALPETMRWIAFSALSSGPMTTSQSPSRHAR